MAKSLHVDRLQSGMCYYPEHWPKALWEDGFRRMRELGFAVIRMAEFAWTTFCRSQRQAPRFWPSMLAITTPEHPRWCATPWAPAVCTITEPCSI